MSATLPEGPADLGPGGGGSETEVESQAAPLLPRLPLKSICERFPEWLAKNAARQTRQEYEGYGRMYQTFQKLCNVYETEPDNFPRLLELMQDLQELGQPPNDIIKELAPGLVVSDDGLPMMPNMGFGSMGPGVGDGLGGGGGFGGGPGGGCAVA